VANNTLIVEGDHNQVIRWTPCTPYLKLKKKENGESHTLARLVKPDRESGRGCVVVQCLVLSFMSIKHRIMIALFWKNHGCSIHVLDECLGMFVSAFYHFLLVFERFKSWIASKAKKLRNS
jgi:hypothetical protein